MTRQDSANTPSPKPSNPPRDVLVLKNLLFSTTKRTLTEFLNGFFPVGERNIVHPLCHGGPYDRQSRGFAYVHFDTTAQAEEAFRALSGKRFNGQLLWLDYAWPEYEKSFESRVNHAAKRAVSEGR